MFLRNVPVIVVLNLYQQGFHFVVKRFAAYWRVRDKSFVWHLFGMFG